MKDLYLGKICMIRTYSAGVHYGTVIAQEDKHVILRNSRRVYYWAGAATLSQLAMEGSKRIEECRITMEVDEIFLSEATEIIPMSEIAIKSLLEVKEWKI